MLDSNATTNTTEPSEAETIMSAAGWTRVTQGDHAAWVFLHDNDEASLITAGGDADADPREVVWTCARFHLEDAHSATAHIARTIGEPMHRNLAQTLVAIPTLAVVEQAEGQDEAVTLQPAFGGGTQVSGSATYPAGAGPLPGTLVHEDEH